MNGAGNRRRAEGEKKKDTGDVGQNNGSEGKGGESGHDFTEQEEEAEEERGSDRGEDALGKTLPPLLMQVCFTSLNVNLPQHAAHILLTWL